MKLGVVVEGGILNHSLLPVSGLEVIKLFSCLAQLRLKFILLLNVKMPTIVTAFGDFNPKFQFIWAILVFMRRGLNLNQTHQ